MDEPRRMAQETALGYELDTITLREIAAVRYVRHHEWLHDVVGTAIPTDRILPPKIETAITESELDDRLAKLKSELADLKKEEAAGWTSSKSDKSQILSEEIANLRDNVDADTAQKSQERVEKEIGKVLVSHGRLNSVPVTYERDVDDLMADI